MRLGSREHDEDDVFLLSTTHGAEVTAMAAAIATIDVYEEQGAGGRAHVSPR